MSLSQSAIAYYHEQADYNGVVAAARLEIEGLTADSYLDWYFRRWRLHYQSLTVPRRGSFYDKYPMGNTWPRIGYWTKFTNRRQSRLYVLRKMRPIKETTLLFKEKHSLVYKFDGHNQVADKKLMIAHLLKRRASELCKDAAILREARTGGWGIIKSINNFYNQEINEPHTAGKRGGAIQTFQWLLVEFDKLLSDAPDKYTSDSSQPEVDAELSGQQVIAFSLRQAAMFYYYTEQPLTENNAADLAAQKGHNSKTSGKQLLSHYAEWCELQEGEPPASSRELGALDRDLSRILPHLSGQAAILAAAYQKRVVNKKKRPF